MVMPASATKKPSTQELIRDFFLFLSQNKENFEQRDGQIEMSEVLAGRMSLGEITLIEAGTGTGKTFAYLLPLILAESFGKQPIILSTATIQLQNQLFEKDIPALWQLIAEFATQRSIPHASLHRKIRAEVMLGRNNFVSRRRALFALSSLDEPDKKNSNMHNPRVALSQWLYSTKTGLLEEIDLPDDLREQVVSQSDNCLGRRCAHHSECFYFAKRRMAASADIVIVNHALLMSDLQLRNAREDGAGILPDYSSVVLDEAHNIPDTAVEHFGLSTSSQGIRKQLRRLHSTAKQKKAGLLQKLEAAPLLLKMALSDTDTDQALDLLDSLQSRNLMLLEALEKWQTALRKELGAQGRKRITVEDDLFSTLQAYTDPLMETFAFLLADLVRLNKYLDPLRDMAQHPLSDVLHELNSVINRLQAHNDAINHIVWAPIRDTVRFLDASARSVHLADHPLEVGRNLSQSLWNNCQTAWLTSATLQTNEKFDVVLRRAGLRAKDGCEADIRTKVIKSPFNWDQQARFLIDTTAPHPNDTAAFEHHIILQIAKLANITRGRMFVLMTNTGQLERLSSGFGLALKSFGLHTLIQGQKSRKALLEDFLLGDSVLFGLYSFWEGVDIPGPALSAVVIPRIPFPSPADPWNAAYQEFLEKSGMNTFKEHMLPNASLKLRQGSGRLIRRTSDTGVVVLLDPRMRTSSYGKNLARDLPVQQLYDLDIEIFEEVFKSL